MTSHPAQTALIDDENQYEPYGVKYQDLKLGNSVNFSGGLPAMDQLATVLPDSALKDS